MMINPHIQEKNYSCPNGMAYLGVNSDSLFMFSNYFGNIGVGSIFVGYAQIQMTGYPTLWAQYKKISGVTIDVNRASVVCCYVGFLPTLRCFTGTTSPGLQFKSFTLA